MALVPVRWGLALADLVTDRGQPGRAVAPREPDPPARLTMRPSEFLRFIGGLPAVDEPSVRALAAKLATRPVEGKARRELLDLTIRMTDLTTPDCAPNASASAP